MTFDEARLMANVNARARRLFQDGYRARWQSSHRLVIRNQSGATYQMDTCHRTCDCPFFLGWKGRHPCKHLLGYRRLLARQRTCRRLVACLLLLAWNDLADTIPTASLEPAQIAEPGPDLQATERRR